jgi:4-hydroxy-tetrahydrodipicolinate synthase
MKKLYPLRGIITVLNTPFSATNALDVPALKRHVAEALQAGVHGFLVPALASEVYKLTIEERLKMVEIVLATVNGKVPVIAGAGETDLHRSRTLLKTYMDLGCQHVLFQIPFRDEAQFKTHFMELAELQPEVIMLQDWDASGYGLPDALILELFEQVEAFRCLKVETVPAGAKYSRILELTEGRLNVSGGWAVTQMLEGLQRGVHAFMPTGMHYIYTQIYQDYISGKQKEAEKLFEAILPVLSFSNQHLDISIHFFKRLLYRQGIYNTPNVRTPILPFDRIHEEIAGRLITKVITIENQIKQRGIYP